MSNSQFEKGKFMNAMIDNCETNLTDLAEHIGISGATLYRKFNTPEKLSMAEFLKFCDELGVDPKDFITSVEK